MVATSDCAEKSRPGNKVSKPVMEKKRRARINQCLDQLKSLLESYYSTSIRKRKLEKADILELTVKHLRNIQKIQSFTAAASDFSDYNTGFRSCLANVNQYLLTAEGLTGSDHWMLSQLSSRLCRSRRRAAAFSTMDSGRDREEAPAEAQRLPSSTDRLKDGNTPQSAPPKLQNTSTPVLLRREDTCQPSGAVQTGLSSAPAGNTTEKNSSPKNFDFHSHRHEAVNTPQSVWRPW
ncbi:hairy-related 3 [Salarias fasciatus]|uniref:hairy-related 3 n=1 Tax=Salarias fasciatus TaxID=181472 RepID=UPI0011769ACA|nr:transcription factor HES-3 [Salarias fasciatus]